MYCVSSLVGGSGDLSLALRSEDWPEMTGGGDVSRRLNGPDDDDDSGGGKERSPLPDERDEIGTLFVE